MFVHTEGFISIDCLKVRPLVSILSRCQVYKLFFCVFQFSFFLVGYLYFAHDFQLHEMEAAMPSVALIEAACDGGCNAFSLALQSRLDSLPVLYVLHLVARLGIHFHYRCCHTKSKEDDNQISNISVEKFREFVYLFWR